MAKFSDYTQTQPYFIPLNSIITNGIESGVSPKVLQKLAEGLNETNLVLPIVCISDKEDSYPLLAGLPIVEAAKLAGLKEIWVMMVAKQKPEAIKTLHSLPDLLKFNDMFADDQMQTAFVQILNDTKFDLTTIKGVKGKTAEKIVKGRPYKNWQDLEEKMRSKRNPLKWLQNYWSK